MNTCKNQVEFSHCNYVSGGPLSHDRRNLVRYDKKQVFFDKGKKDPFCIRNDTMADGLNKCISYVTFTNK